MFRSHAGFRGCALVRVGADCTVVRPWERPEDAAVLEDSDRYRETVAAITATGFVRRTERTLAAPLMS